MAWPTASYLGRRPVASDWAWWHKRTKGGGKEGKEKRKGTSCLFTPEQHGGLEGGHRSTRKGKMEKEERGGGRRERERGVFLQDFSPTFVSQTHGEHYLSQVAGEREDRRWGKGGKEGEERGKGGGKKEGAHLSRFPSSSFVLLSPVVFFFVGRCVGGKRGGRRKGGGGGGEEGEKRLSYCFFSASPQAAQSRRPPPTRRKKKEREKGGGEERKGEGGPYHYEFLTILFLISRLN